MLCLYLICGGRGLVLKTLSRCAFTYPPGHYLTVERGWLRRLVKGSAATTSRGFSVGGWPMIRIRSSLLFALVVIVGVAFCGAIIMWAQQYNKQIEQEIAAPPVRLLSHF